MTMSRINKMALCVKPVLSLDILMLGAETIAAHTSYRIAVMKNHAALMYAQMGIRSTAVS